MSYVVASFSGGKDSTAMVLHMIEMGEHIDEVINVDTGMEFPEMYKHIEKVRKIIEDAGIKFTALRNDMPFEYVMFDQLIQSKKYGDHYGYGWPTPVIRWCTRYMKTDVLKKYYRTLTEEKESIVQCVGLAADEVKRLEREHNNQKGHRHPLAEWGWTEKDCLEYCYKRGFDWDGLYRIFNRVSCWCCPLANIGELRKLWKYRPELWERLQNMDDRVMSNPKIYAKFKGQYTVADLTARFEREERAKREQRILDNF